jgi:hypothetical protein
VSDDDRTLEAHGRAAQGAGIALGRLCAPDAVRRLRGRDRGAAYAIASAAAHVIVARHGTEGLFALYDAFNDAGLEGPPGRALTDRALRRTLGMSLPELQAAASG